MTYNVFGGTLNLAQSLQFRVRETTKYLWKSEVFLAPIIAVNVLVRNSKQQKCVLVKNLHRNIKHSVQNTKWNV